MDALYSQQWGFTGTHGMRVPGAWDRTTGSGATVAVIDTGITSHPDLDRNVVPGYDFISDSAAARDGGGRDSNPRDEGDWYAAGECGTAGASDSSWHGTHVAGTVAAVADSQGVVGVAPNAKIQPIRVLGKCGGSLSDIADAVVWAAGGTVAGVPANPNPADVINMSLGGSGMCGTTYQNAINAAVSRGVPVVVAAGNENQPAANVRPANCQNTIVVAASTSQGARASFSNYGSAVDVTAPGANIISTVNNGATTPTTAGHAAYNGTSMATPHVAGLAALLLAAQPSLTPAQVESTLRSTARSMPVTCSAGCGAGLADATAAVSSLGGAQTEPGPAPVASLIVNGGFESGSTGWTGTPTGFVRTDAAKAASGQAFAQLNGVGRRNTATVEQKVTVPASGATLTYALQVDTAETTVTRSYDLLDVQVVTGATGTYTVASHSNLGKGGYATRTLDLSRFAGTTVTLRFRGTEDSSAATTFRIDEVAVTAR
ncbi:S8 family peptidase [Micrococcus luteus]|uniref:S8 family peptidase n=1 Tax=Micrococcus luteus TaxID=1270 RepID=UPI0020035A07